MRAAPASTDTIPTSANQEDHVSMAAHGARRLLPMAENLAAIVGIEALMAAQGIELRKPLSPGPRVATALARVRAHSAFLETDRVLAGEMAAVAAEIASGAFLAGHADILALLPSGGPAR